MAEKSNKLVCVVLEATCWSGSSKLSKEALIGALGTAVTELPPEQLASLGAIKIFDPEELKFFTRLRGEANRYLDAIGVPYCGGRAVPVAKIHEASDALTEMSNRWKSRARELYRDFDSKAASWRDKWVKENPKYAGLMKVPPTAEAVFGKLSFHWKCFCVEEPKPWDPDEIKHTHRQETSGLLGELQKEVVELSQTMAQKYLLDDSGVKREFITQKTVAPLKRLAVKLRDFAFVAPEAGVIAGLIEGVTGALPQEGKFGGADLLSVWTLVHSLSNFEELRAVAQANCVSTTPKVEDDGWAALGLGGMTPVEPMTLTSAHGIESDRLRVMF